MFINKKPFFGGNMKRLFLLLFFMIGTLVAQDYVGAAKCKACHNSESKGAQFSKWEATRHANSFETLKSEKAAEIAAKKGLKVPAYEAAECVACHTTGFGKGGYEIKDAAFWAEVTDKGKPTSDVKRMESLQNVGCEVCHGPGSEYKSSKVMKGLADGSVDAASVGYTVPSEKTCTGCHNEKSPTFKGFNFKEYLPKVAHPRPE